MLNDFVVLLLLLGVVLAGGQLGNRFARQRLAGGDPAPLWFAHLLFTTVLFIVSGLFYLADFSFDQHYSGRIANYFVTLIPFSSAYILALLWPVLFWVLLFCLILFRGRAPRAYRALSGTLTGTVYRGWVRWPAMLPTLLVALLLPFVYKAYPANYPVYLYSLLILLVVDLLFLSQGHKEAARQEPVPENPVRQTSVNRTPWLEALEAGGVKASLKCILQPEPMAAAPNDTLDNAVDELLDVEGSKEDKSKLTKLIIGPDQSGQLEAVVRAARTLYLRHFASTLLVVSRESMADIQRQLHGILAATEPNPEEMVPVIAKDNLYPREKNIFIRLISPETLSDYFLPNFLAASELNAKQIGLIAWWNIHEYTGVTAAHLWAIARRMHRLLKQNGRRYLRTIAFSRGNYHHGANMNRFIESILPTDRTITPVYIKKRLSKPLSIYTLDRFTDTDCPSPPTREMQKHLLLYAAQASIRGGWRTYISGVESFLSKNEQTSFFNQDVLDTPSHQKGPLAGHLSQGIHQADASLINITPHNVLYLDDIIANAGRMATADGHCIGLLICDHPYVAFIMSHYFNQAADKQERRMPLSRTPITPRPRSAIVRRHLVKALSEISMTRSDILTDYHYEEARIDATLEQIRRGRTQLPREEVRYLDGGLKIEPRYLRNTAYDQIYDIPLDTVGETRESLAEIIAIAPHNEENSATKLVIDRERISFLAYPGRVFFAGGRQYMIEPDIAKWSEQKENSRILCTSAEAPYRTQRKFFGRLHDFHNMSKPKNFCTSSGCSFQLLHADSTYQDIVDGITHQALYSFRHSGSSRHSHGSTFAPIRSDQFDCRVLVIGFTRALANEAGVNTIALCLRHLLPVHLGIGDDVLGAVGLVDEPLSEVERITGVGLCELFPRDIGLVEAIPETLISDMLAWCRNWLKSCDCQDGCHDCFAHYLDNRISLSKQDALSILEGRA